MPKPKLVAFTLHQHPNPKAPVVVLIPGVGCGCSFWASALAPLTPDYTVLTFSNPGVCGAPAANLFTVEELAFDILSVLEDFGITKCHMVGHSMGGYIAQRLCRLRPDIVDRLVLISTSYGGRATDQDITNVLSYMLPIWPKQRKLVRTNPYEAFKFAVGRDTPERNPEGYAAFVENRTNPKTPEEVYAAHFFCAIKFSGLAGLPNLTMPTLVIHGNDDNIIAFEAGKEMASRLPNARFIEKDCGHCPPFEDPNMYADIRTFLQGGKIGQVLPKAAPLTAKELREDAIWKRRRMGTLRMTALFALSKGLPVGVQHWIKSFTG